MNYFDLIHRCIPPDSALYPIYITHCHMVTRKSLEIAERIGLSPASQRFIEEAAMLHDIGIITTDTPNLHCFGTLHYLCHGVEGRAILEAEGYAAHGLVAERHIGVGLTVADIIEQDLPLPHRDMTAQSVEEEIISYADLFYSKDVNRLWQAKPLEKVQANVTRYGEKKGEILADWARRFEGMGK